MNGSLSLLENIQTSFLSGVKSKHLIVKKCISLLNGTEFDETVSPPVLIKINPTIIPEILSWVFFVCEKNEIPPQLQEYAEDEQHSTIFMGLYTLFTEAIRTRTIDRNFKDVLHSFNLPKNYQDLFMQSFVENHTQLTSLARNETISNPSMEQFDWRVDVIISTTALNKAFVPILVLQMTTSDDQIYTFECQITKFHQLRYSVAKMLANMQTIDQHPTLMRLID
jgi:hypothetical protein